MKIRLRQVEGFLALADTLSFSRAAQQLNMTQPAFSQMIREMEATLELPLFERSTRRVRLLPAGENLLGQMRQGLDNLKKACQQAQAMARMEHGHLAIATLPSLACGVILEVMARYRRHYPKITLELSEDHNRQILDSLSAGNVELAVGSAMPGYDHLKFDPIFYDELVCVIPKNHPLARQEEISWSQLSKESIILVAATSHTYQVIKTTLSLLADGKEADYQTLNAVTALSMTREGFGLTFIPEITLPALNMRGLCYRPLSTPKPRRQIGVFRRQETGLSPAAQAFLEMLMTSVPSRSTQPRQ